MSIEKRIEEANKKIIPFNLIAYKNGKYGLSLMFTFLKGEYENYCQDAFNQYAADKGRPVKDSGLYTHGHGFHWEYVFKECFSNHDGFEQIDFDCESGGFYCNSNNYDLLERLAIEFKAICDDKDKFQDMVNKALLKYDRDKEISEKSADQEESQENIKPITTNDLRRMHDKEGLILQGCGGDLQEWFDGINEILTDEEILLDGTKFETAYSFEKDGHTNLLFPFDDVKLNVGKFAIWRLITHSQFNGTWLTDYVPNDLGGFITEEKQKPDCELINQDSNIFNLMGIASRTLRRNGMADEANEMCTRIRASDNYYKALGIISEYVNITGPDDDMSEDEGMNMQL